MKPLTAEWLDKAEGDFAVMERESRVRRNPAHDIVCFHAQQCVEKYLKARLCHAGAEAGRLWELLGVSATEQGLIVPWSWVRITPGFLRLRSVFSLKNRSTWGAAGDAGAGHELTGREDTAESRPAPATASRARGTSPPCREGEPGAASGGRGRGRPEPWRSSRPSSTRWPRGPCRPRAGSPCRRA